LGQRGRRLPANETENATREGHDLLSQLRASRRRENQADKEEGGVNKKSKGVIKKGQDLYNRRKKRSKKRRTQVREGKI